MKIAVIIPIYNQAAYLRRCLDSLVAQTDGDFTAYCVNDGSTDASQEIIDEFVARDSRFIAVRKPNGGLSSARNAGIEASDRAGGADGLMFLDSDDFYHPQCVEAVRRAAAQNPGAIVEYRFESVCAQETFAARRYDLDKVVAEEAFSDSATNKLWLRSLMGQLRFDEQVRFAEDVVFSTTLRLKAHPKSIRIPLDLYYYSDNPDSMTRVAVTVENFRRRNVAVERLLAAFSDDLRGLQTLTHTSLPSLLKRFYRDLRRSVGSGTYAETRRVFATELAALRRRGFLHWDRECLKDIKYYLIFLFMSIAYAHEERAS